MAARDSDGAGQGLNRREMLAIAGASTAVLASGAGPTATSAGGATVFTHIGVLVGDKVREDAALAVVGGRIAAIGDSDALLKAYPGADIYSGRGKLVMPGLVNCHAHLAATIARGLTRISAFPVRPI